jgi:hypothetical protein
VTVQQQNYADQEHPLTDLDKRLFSRFRAIIKYDIEIQTQQFAKFSSGEFTADDIRNILDLEHNASFPDLKHQFGAMVLRWKIHKLITPTGQYRSSRVASNHGHKIAVYVFGNGGIPN